MEKIVLYAALAAAAILWFEPRARVDGIASAESGHFKAGVHEVVPWPRGTVSGLPGGMLTGPGIVAR